MGEAGIIERMYAGTVATVSALAAYALECAATVGVSAEEYRAMSWEDREAVIKRGKKVLKKR